MVAAYNPISDIVPWTQSIAGINQFVYSTNWTANNASDILVYSRAQGIPVSDTLQLVDSSNYTVQFVGSQNTVQVTFISPYNPPQYNIVTIMRNTPSQFLNLYTNTNFLPSMLNGDFENLVQVDQQNQLYWQQIVPRYNNSASVNVPIDTILPVLKAGEFWIKNSTNTAFIAATLSGSGTFPVLGPFVLYTANSNYPEGFNLGSLADGLLAQNTTLGVSTPYVIPFPINVVYGGTGLNSITPYAVLLGGATSTSPIAPISSLGSAGYVLTSSGVGAPPTWQPPVDDNSVPVGSVLDFAGTSAPANFLICNGQSLSTTTYATLFAVIGYTWGGSGATFNVPNFQGYVSAGSGGTLFSGSDTVGLTGGASSVSLTENNLPAHTHASNQNGFVEVVPAGFGSSNPVNASPNNTFVSSGATGNNSTTHTDVNIVQKTNIVLKIIKYQ